MPPIIYLISEQQEIRLALSDFIEQNIDIPYEILSFTTIFKDYLQSKAWILMDLTVNPAVKLKNIAHLIFYRPDVRFIILHEYLPNGVINNYKDLENVFFVDIIHAPSFLEQMFTKITK